MATDIRQTILDELDRQEVSRYWLTQNVDAGEHTIYAFLRGDKGASMPVIEKMFDALDLRIVPGETVKRKPRRKKKR